MAITYHAGRRIQGTSTDATAVLGGWKELARTTLGSNSVDIDGYYFPDMKLVFFPDNVFGYHSLSTPFAC